MCEFWKDRNGIVLPRRDYFVDACAENPAESDTVAIMSERDLLRNRRRPGLRALEC